MMARDPSAAFVTSDGTVESALRTIAASGYRIALLLNPDGCLLRTVSDGDIRRHLLRGGKLTDPVSALGSQTPVTAREHTSNRDALVVMNTHDIDHLPIVDSAEQPVGILYRKDIDDRILLSVPHMSGEEQAFVDEAFRTNWIAPLGPNVDAFEAEFSEIVGVGAAAAVSSGTAALHLALRLIGVQHGDIVLCSSFTFVATANPILYQGAEPVFVDSEPESWNMSPDALKQAIRHCETLGRKPAAAMVANIYGQSAQYHDILRLCDAAGIPVIEDAAESLGATYQGRPSGSFGRLGAFSFNGNKIITTSGGGMLVSDDEAVIEKCRFLATQARDSLPHYEHSELGYNYRMSNILAGVGRGQLCVLADRVETRRRIFERYRAGLAGVEGIEWMPELPHGRSTRWLSVCTLSASLTSMDTESFVSEMGKRRIEARRVWKPLHRQPLFRGTQYFSAGSSLCDQLFNEAVCLPSGSSLSDAEQARIIKVIRKVLGAAPRSTSPSAIQID